VGSISFVVDISRSYGYEIPAAVLLISRLQYWQPKLQNLGIVQIAFIDAASFLNKMLWLCQ
jgi:hypothetical protein